MTLSTLTPGQFQAFREAKRLVQQEFRHSLSLTAVDWQDNLHTFSGLSRNSRLKELAKTLGSHP